MNEHEGVGDISGEPHLAIFSQNRAVWSKTAALVERVFCYGPGLLNGESLTVFGDFSLAIPRCLVNASHHPEPLANDPGISVPGIPISGQNSIMVAELSLA